MLSAVREKPAFRFVLDSLEISVISPHMTPSDGNSLNLQHAASTTLPEPHMTGIGDRWGIK